jgi:ribosomal protein S18 acetylase RimI-like enzyme
MRRDEVDLALDWAAKEGWNPGLYDAETFYKTDPNGFLIGELNTEPIGCISVVAYDDCYGFLGFYIVKPEFRGKGYGFKLWRKGMEYLGSRNIGLDGVVAQQDNYKKSGFKLAYRNIRFEGVAKTREYNGLMDANDLYFKELINYDRLMYPVHRTTFIKNWITQPESKALAYRANDNLQGYGVIRKCRKGYKIGPLFADNEKIAINLFNGLTAEIPGKKFYLDIPEVNPLAIKLAESNDMRVVFETARMYTNREPDIHMENIYGVSTFELG